LFSNTKLFLRKIVQVPEYLVFIVIMGAEVICKSACCFFSVSYEKLFLQTFFTDQ
jgi:hypothetical protein